MTLIRTIDFGGKRDRDDSRDYAFTPGLAAPPSRADLRSDCAVVYDQLPPIRSCAANAVAAALVTLAGKSRAALSPSRLFLYYNARLRNGTPIADDGTTIRDAIKAAAQPGACAESVWPYDPANVNTEPPSAAYQSIIGRAGSYYRLPQTLSAIKSCIAEGFPVVFGLNAYLEAFTYAQTHVRLELPSGNDQCVGGHAMLALGYDDTLDAVITLNSLGKNWGDRGYTNVDYRYFASAALTYDFWTIRRLV